MSGNRKYQSEMCNGRCGAGVEASLTMAAKHAGNAVLFQDVRLHGFLLWGGGGDGIFKGMFQMGRKRGAGTVICEDESFEKGDRVLETGDFLHGVDSAGIAVFRG